MASQNSCPLCHSDSYKPVFKDHGYDGIRYEIVRCTSCTLKFIDPKPPDEHLEKIYASYYGDEANQAETEKHLKFRRNVFSDLLKKLEVSKKTDSKILDIGCGNGDFLFLAHERGWKTFGIEISERAVEYASKKRNLNVIQGSLHELPFGDGAFDVITLLDVLEHLSNPLQVLSEAFRALKPGGSIWIRVPNTPFQLMKARIQRLQHGLEFTTMAVPLHLNHFDSNSLSKALEKAGFRDLKINPGAADGVGINLNVKRVYCSFSKLISTLTGRQIGNILCLEAKKPNTSKKD